MFHLERGDLEREGGYVSNYWGAGGGHLDLEQGVNLLMFLYSVILG